MTLLAGIEAGAEPRTQRAARGIGSWQQAADLREGWHVQLGDGRWARVVGQPVVGALGRVQVPVFTDVHLTLAGMGLDPEWVAYGWRRLVWTRTEAEYAQYLDALEVELREMAMREGLR